MKKIIRGFLALALLVLSNVPVNAQVAGCTNSVNLVNNWDFSLGNTGFGSALTMSLVNCQTSAYRITTASNIKCTAWTPAWGDNSGTGNCMFIDGPGAGGAVNVWTQTVNVCPNTNYTFSFFGRNVYTINLFPVNFVIDGVTTAGTNITGGAWNQYSMVWNSGTTTGPILIALAIPSGNAYRDFAIDDIFFGYCGDLTVTPSTTICSGDCATLTATSAATNYSWSTGATTASILACPTSTTTYSVTATSTGGCINYGTLSTTVTVNPSPTVTATATPATLTPPSVSTSFISTTTTGGTGFTYSWAPAAGLSSTTIANPVATPTATTIYTVTVTNSAGCTGTATVQVTVTPYPLCALTYNYTIAGPANVSSVFPPGGVTGQNIHITGVLTVDNSFNFGSCNIVMEPGSRIEVQSPAVLYITSNTHIYTCDGMWDGINLQNGSSLQIVNASIIEDALNAVTVNQGSTALIDHCVFNRNYTAVKVTANTSAVSPLAMTSSVVCSVDLGITWSNPALNPSSSLVWSNIVASAYTTANMKTPFYGYRSIYGILAADVNMLQVGSAAASGIFNGFDNMMAAGIHATRSNVIVYNNKFRSITNTVNCIGCTPLIGVAVYGIGNLTTAYTMAVGGTGANQANDFYNVKTAVEITQYTNQLVKENTVTNTSSTNATYGGYGKMGVKISPSANNTIDVSGNTIINAASGIAVTRNTTVTPQTNALTIDDNDVSANASGFCTTGISFTDASGVVISSVVSEINYNRIVEAATCISVTNVVMKNNIYYNSCLTRYAASGNLNGIKLTNCQQQNVQQNHTKYNVTVGTNVLAYGISLTNSPGNPVDCNTIENATRSLVFSGNCNSPLQVTQNTFRNAQAGLVLLTTGTVIGQQGNAAQGSNNYWDMTSTMTTQIINASGSPLDLYVTAGSPPAQTTIPTSFSGTVNVYGSGSAPTPCGSVPARLANPVSPQETVMTTEPAALVVYPNPNNGQFTVSTFTDITKDVLVYDVNGRLVYSSIQTTDMNVTVDISGEAKGLYIVQVVSGDHVESIRVSNQ